MKKSKRKTTDDQRTGYITSNKESRKRDKQGQKKGKNKSKKGKKK